MDTEFMVINEFFLHTTLDSILQDAARLSSAESGFVIGQVLEGLKYLHGQGWIHENLDPRSILVLAKDRLFVKVADFALSGMVDLGKPIGYHSEYASQKIAEKYDQYPMDIWSVGVVGLRLLKGVIPARPRFTLDRQCEYVVSLDRHVRSLSRTRSDDNGLRFLTRVLKSRYQDRPTATKLLLDPWIQETKNYEVLQLPISQSIIPQSPRHASVGPFNRGPSSIISRQSSKDRMARPLPNPTSPDDYNDFESEPGAPTSRSSKFTANPLALEPSLRSRTPMPFYSEDKSEIPSRLVGSPHSQSRISGGNFPVAYDEHGSATPPSRRSADSPSQTSHASTGYNADDELSILRGKGSSRSQSRNSTDRYGRREAQIEENGSVKTESAKSQGPVAKKARRGPAVPLSGVILRSRGKKPALRPSGRYTEG